MNQELAKRITSIIYTSNVHFKCILKNICFRNVLKSLLLIKYLQHISSRFDAFDSNTLIYIMLLFPLVTFFCNYILCTDISFMPLFLLLFLHMSPKRNNATITQGFLLQCMLRIWTSTTFHTWAMTNQTNVILYALLRHQKLNSSVFNNLVVFCYQPKL